MTDDGSEVSSNRRREPLTGAPGSGLPEQFVERLSQIIAPVDFEAALRSFSSPRATGFRVNTLIAEDAEVFDVLGALGLTLTPAGWLPHAFSVSDDDREALLASSAYLKAQIYIQNLSSMIPPFLLDPRPGEEILDLTAAPGSKTHQLACAMHNTGRITAVESVRTRYYKLRDNMARLGAECVRPFFQDGTRTWRYRPEFFDRVLLDAPCSSEGRFRTSDPSTTRYWTRRKVMEMSRKQRRLLYSAVRCLKPEGRLVYSTCSFSPEENEVVIHKLLTKFGGAIAVSPIPLDLPQFRPALRRWQGREFAEEIGMARRVVPDGKMDGFFVCVLHKLRSTEG